VEKLKMAHFKITGETFTLLARARYADDGEPGKAVALLEAAFPEMEPAVRMAILTGSKKLVGDEHGMELEDDHATHTEAGTPLDLTRTVSHLRQELDKYRDAAADLIAMQTGDTALIGTETGAVLVPRRRERGIHSGKISWKDVHHRAYESNPFPKLRPGKPESSVPSPPIQSIKVDPQPKITSNNGWLSPDGTFYPCGYSEHLVLAEAMCYDPTQIGNSGWVKICRFEILSESGQPEDTALPGTHPPTQAQIDRVFDWLGYLPAVFKLALEDSP
jgi:hypothetical protein